jgi:hypothetical protein
VQSGGDEVVIPEVRRKSRGPDGAMSRRAEFERREGLRGNYSIQPVSASLQHCHPGMASEPSSGKSTRQSVSRAWMATRAAGTTRASRTNRITRASGADSDAYNDPCV